MIQQTENINMKFHGIHIGSQETEEMFDTWSYESDQPLSLERLREMVRRELPDSIYRCKGILYADSNIAKRIALQIVGRRTEIRELDEWGERAPFTKVVAIGSSNRMQPDFLTALFERCVVKPETR